MAPPQVVIFDCDGVFVDSERIAVRIDAEVLGYWMAPWRERDRRALRRPLARVHGRRDRGASRAPAAARLGVAPVEGVNEALDAISIPTCVASSGSHEKIARSLRLVGLYERFAGRIFSVTDVADGKPAPDLFLHAAEQLGADPAACAVVEDSAFGIAAARAAGMIPFGFAGGLTPRERLAGPDTVVFDDMRELPRLLDTSRSRS